MPATSGFQLLELPMELIVITLEYLPHRDLVACSYACHALRDIITQFPALQYSCELGVTGLEDIPTSLLPKATKLATLRKYQENWANLHYLQLDKRNSIRIPIHSGPAWELSGGVIAQSKGPNAIEYIQLPSKTRGIPHQKWTANLPENVKKRDFTIDPGQDLVVVVEDPSTHNHNVMDRRVMLHLLSMSTGKFHPMAKERTLSVRNIPAGAHMFEIRISRHYVGVLVSPVVEQADEPPSWSYFSLWDWRTGSELYAQRTSACSSFAFLSEDYVALLHLLEPYHDPQDAEFLTKAALTVFEIPLPGGGTPERPQCWMFELPYCQNLTCMIQDLEILCESPPTWTSKNTSTGGTSDKGDANRITPPPFGISASERIMVLAMNVVDFSELDEEDMGPRLYSLQFVVLISGLLQEIKDSLAMHHTNKFDIGIQRDDAFEIPDFAPTPRFTVDDELRTPDIRYKWFGWGLDRTRVLHLQRAWQSSWPCISYGTRLVFNDHEDGIVVYDFNPFAVRKALHDHEDTPAPEDTTQVPADEYGDTWGVVKREYEKLGDPFSAAFRFEVQSNLPYVWYRTRINRAEATRVILNTPKSDDSDDDSDDEDDRVTAAMLSEDSIILIHGWDPDAAYLAVEVDYW